LVRAVGVLRPLRRDDRLRRQVRVGVRGRERLGRPVPPREVERGGLPRRPELRRLRRSADVIIFPAMDLWNGEIVKLEAKQHRTVETVYGKPGEIADRWLAQGATWLHVVDLNAALGEGNNVPALT